MMKIFKVFSIFHFNYPIRPKSQELQISTIYTLMLLLISSTLMYISESSIQPEIILELDKDIRKEIISVVGEHTFLDVVSKLDTDDLIEILEELDLKKMESE